LEEALRLDPNLSAAYAHMGNTLILLGRADEAPKFLKKASNLSKPPSERGLIFWFTGRAYFHMGRYAEAIDWLRRAVEARDAWFVRAHLISGFALTDQLDEARRHFGCHG
jgi:tetratricopeptide (TPR) repeat protein